MLFVILAGASSVQTIQANMSAENLLECSNMVRSEFGVAPLEYNSTLSRAARLKALDMKKYQYWAHRNPITGKYAWPFISAAGYDYKIAGENLAIGFSIGEHICEAWKNSPTHLANLINEDFKEVGFARMEADLGVQKGVLVIQLLGDRKEAPNFIQASLFEDMHPVHVKVFFLGMLSCLLAIMWYSWEGKSPQNKR